MRGEDEAELAALLRVAIAGDERSYASFLQRCAPIVRAFVRGKVGHGGIDPEDVVQETLLAIHLKRHTWLADGPVMPWVYAIARHKTIDAFRRRGKRVEIDLEDVVDRLVQPEAETVSSGEIDRALATLAPGQRSVVGAISVKGWSIAETARRLDMTETAVRVALHRGLAAISKRFGRE